MYKEQGQVIIVLLLIMLVGLTIGLAITQRSLSDVSTSTQSEQASRAYFAAQAGIEQAIQNNQTGSVITTSQSLGNEASIENVKVSDFLPKASQALEYPPIGKETIAQFWLVEASNNNSFPVEEYIMCVNPISGACTQWNSLEVYFGNFIPTSGAPNTPDDSNQSKVPAIEVNLVTYESSKYYSHKSYFDPINSRSIQNGFSFISSSDCQRAYDPGINTTNSPNTDPTINDRKFRCKATIDFGSLGISRNHIPVLLRVRIFYAQDKQPIALKPVNGSLPAQARIYTSIGKSGQTTKILQVFKQDFVVPPFFDYAIFSASNIAK